MLQYTLKQENASKTICTKEITDYSEFVVIPDEVIKFTTQWGTTSSYMKNCCTEEDRGISHRQVSMYIRLHMSVTEGQQN